MAKKKKKCCSYLQSARLSSQTKIALIAFSLTFMVLIVGAMMLNIYLIASFTYKEIYKLIDIDEFNELTFAENNLENAQLQFENTFKSTLMTIVNLYKELSNGTIKIDFYYELNKDFNLITWKDLNKTNSTYDPKKSMFTSINLLDEDADFGNFNFLSYLGIYLEKIFSYKKIFMNINNDPLMYLLISCDYKTNFNFYYPAYTDRVREFDSDVIKKYVIQKIAQKVKDVAMYKEILINKLDYYDDLFLLPYYDEDKDNDKYLFNGNNLTYEIFDEEFLNETNIKINEIAFMIVPERDLTTGDYINIDLSNINENIAQIFLLIGINGTNEVIYDKIINQQDGLSLLRTEYLFPYELTSKQNCYNISLLGLNENDEQYQNFITNTNLSQLKYLDDCFDKNSKIDKYQNYKIYRDYSTYDKFVEDFSIFTNNISKSYNSNIVKLYKTIEQKYLQNQVTSFNKTITRMGIINNQNFKIKKTYSPLNIIHQINYFYPIDNIKMNILIKNEDYSTLLLSENRDILNGILLAGITYLVISVVILEIIIIIIISYFAEELNKPLDILNKPSFITGQIKEGEYENNNKSLKGRNINSDNKIHIDEFKDLIKSVSEALKSETEFEQKINKQEEDDMKLEMENLNKEFEKNKIFNIMVDENKINKILEENNYSNEIIKHKTNIENVKNDSFVKKSYLFREFVKMDEFDEIDNSRESSSIVDNDTLFKDENTLQNPNSLFYDLFKKEFDENYVRRIEEMRVKKESEKRKKKGTKNYTFKTEENLKEKIHKKIEEKKKKNGLSKDNNIYNINNIEEESNKIDFEDEFDIKNENDDEINNINNYFNNKNQEEDNILKLYTESLLDKEEDDELLNKNPKSNNIIEEEIDTSKH